MDIKTESVNQVYKDTGAYFLEDDYSYRPCSIDEWAQQVESFRENNRRKVGYDMFNGMTISTVWLGLEHGYDDSGRPLVFKTMIFDSNFHEQYQKRYSTYTEALAGHQEAVELTKQKDFNEPDKTS